MHKHQSIKPTSPKVCEHCGRHGAVKTNDGYLHSICVRPNAEKTTMLQDKQDLQFMATTGKCPMCRTKVCTHFPNGNI